MSRKSLKTWFLAAAVTGAITAAIALLRLARPPTPRAPSTRPPQTSSRAVDCRHVAYAERFYTVVTLDLDAAELRLFWKKPDGTRYANFRSLRTDLARSGRPLFFATNAGIFDPTFTPSGLHVEDGKPLVPLNLADGYGNFYLKPNGVFLIDARGARIVKSADYPPLARSGQAMKIATQSGPLLLLGGRVHPAFRRDSTARAVRSGVGVVSPRQVVFALSDEPVNFDEFARLFREGLGCRDALYLDGTISRFYVPGSADAAAHDGSGDDGAGNFAGILVGMGK